MTEVLFYHLERQPLERVLPTLLEKSRERGWRAVIRTVSAERVTALDEHLWTYSDESFLPHAIASEAGPGDEPIVITTEAVDLNAPQIAFLVDGVDLPDDVTAYQRVVLLFDGNDASALEQARAAWKTVRDRGLDGTYWQQNDQGRWEKRA